LSRRDAWFVGTGVLTTLVLVFVVGVLLQDRAQRGAITRPGASTTKLKEQREVDKLTAEIKQIRSDTTGSLFWLKLAGVFVTVGAAVGGYLVAQSKSSRDRALAAERQTRMRLDFDHRAQVDTAFQNIVQELSATESPLLRATAAMKLGKLLQAPPVEWHLEPARRDELWALSKQILAASLAIERDEKVLKALTIAVALHADQTERSDLRGLDFSLARAADAYWARVDFTFADFYRADLTGASLRRATLSGAQFRETLLVNAVLADAVCSETNFKYTDLRGADLSRADLTSASFEEAKVHGCIVAGAIVTDVPGNVVDISPDGDGSQMVAVASWLTAAAD
jgi:uncharacterized protein YjbI with pentapeptide repeats